MAKENDIFGVDFQNSLSKEYRRKMGIHYTNVENILKVINPLFLENLKEELERANSTDKIKCFLERLSKIKIFDPACGCGNFLIVAYQELKKIERAALMKNKEIKEIEYVQIENFYGIEIDESAVKLAYDSISIVCEQEHIRDKKNTPLLIQKKPKIINANALRIDWNEVCSRDEASEIYVIGNPPYLGSKNQNLEQRKDMEFVFQGLDEFKKLDLVGAWFYLASKYIGGINAKASFVSVNSICQGEQVALLWPKVYQNNIKIDYAYTSFPWSNEAKGNAVVYVVIIGLCNNNNNDNRRIYSNNNYKLVKNINPYLAEGDNLIIRRTNRQISNLPNMQKGIYAIDDGYLKLSPQEKDELIESYPVTKSFIRELVGGKEFINGDKRYCLWIKDENLDCALQIPFIKDRIEKVREFRKNSKNLANQRLAERSHQFETMVGEGLTKIIIPTTSSQRREYIPITFADEKQIVINSLQAIYNPEFYIFGILNSKMHNLWTKTVGGKMKIDISYSKDLCYNTFPFPEITEKQKQQIEEAAYDILDIREMHSGKTLAHLYDPDRMPDDLREAHHNLDLIVEKCYQDKPFKDDNERLQVLFQMYKEMTGK